MLWSLIFDTLLYCTAEKRLVNDLDWNQQSGFAVWKQTPISCPAERLFKFYYSHLNSAITMRRGFHDLIAQQFSTFSLLAVIFRTKLNKITSRRFQLHLRKAPFCSGITFHVFIFTYSPLLQYHRPSARSKSPNSLQCENARISSSQLRSRR